MRYIKKRNPQAVALLSEFIANQNAAGGTNLTYSAFPHKEQLNELLRNEQGSICCYCMQRIVHFQGIQESGSHNEHFASQAGNPELELDYYNLYACCIVSKGNPPSQQHCGEHKGSNSISDFIKRHRCSRFFKYNAVGEITPNGIYQTEQEYQEQETQQRLPKNQTDALQTIKILNLNCSSLKSLREKITADVEKAAIGMTPQQAQTKIDRLITQNPLPTFVEVVIQTLQKRR